MSKVIDAPAASSPATETFTGEPEDGFAEFQAEQRQSSVPVVEKPPEKAAPDSEPVVDATPVAKPKQEPLTDAQKSELKKRNNERRWAEREREIAALKAENERLKAVPAAKPAESATAAAKKDVLPEDPNDPKPKQSDFTDFDDYVDARSSWNARQILKADRARQETAQVQSVQREQAVTFMDSLTTYAKEHDGFFGTADEPGPFETVRDALETTLPEVSAAIAEHDEAPALIDYLGRNPEALDRILSHEGSPVKALIELGKVVAAEFKAPPVVEPIQPPKKTLPKPPAAVTTRGRVLSGEAALDAAAEADDFEAFQKSYYGNKGQKVPRR